MPAFGGRVLMKEPYGNWFGFKPLYPEYGTFEATGKAKHEVLNKGKKYTKRAGFRFASYTILVKPGTKIKVPKSKASEQRTGKTGTNNTEERIFGSFTIGVSKNVSVNEFVEFLKTCKKASLIIGCISPKQRKYQWGGVIHQANASGSGLSGLGGGDLGGLLGDGISILKGGGGGIVKLSDLL